MIDAHQHFWRLARGDYDWLTPDLETLYRDFEPADYLAQSRAHGIERSVVVQAAATTAETDYLLSLADAHAFIAGIVGWVDFEAAGAVGQLEKWRAHPRFVGVRPMIQDIADPDWMLGEALTRCFDALCALDLRFDALVHPHHLGRLRRLCERHPALRIVIDHAAKPGIAARDFDEWAREMALIAYQTEVHCKLSGLVTEAEADWTTDSLRPYVEHLFACFGADRLLWGSDWPVVELAGGLSQWHAASDELLSECSQDERAAVQEHNAVRFYGLAPSQRGKEDR